MTNIFLVIGSVADPHRAREAGDIDLVVPEFTDDRMYTSAVDLSPTRRLPRRPASRSISSSRRTHPI